jgi:pimeloyl-ACP methyl ester carboxylesterase
VGRRLIVIFALALVAVALLPGLARAAARLAPCGKTPGLECTQVDVPLDRSGAVPGTVSLHVEVLPPSPTSIPRGAFFLIAGGPGQGSARAFQLRSPLSADFMRAMLPGYTLVAVDNRGTGASGAINCQELQSNFDAVVDKLARLARDCAAIIGPSRQFYSTRDHAEDLEAVRRSLGFAKIALYGVSYGTKLALAYALVHPDHVERLLLDSVLPAELPDPFERNVVRAMPTTLAAFCAGGRCRGVTADYPGDVAALANRLQAQPIRGRVVTAAGRRQSVRMTGEDLLGLVIDTDLNAGLAAELPGAVRAARTGYARPLLHLLELDHAGSSESPVELSAGLYAATTCADGGFPWAPTTPVGDRREILDAAIAALPPGSLGRFGRWVARTGTASFCELWPSPAGNAPLGPGPLPNVPVLAVSGGLDLRTPTANAIDVVRRFPQGQLLVTPGIGHSVLGVDYSLCSQREVRYWVLGLLVRSACPRPPTLVRTVPILPRRHARHTRSSTLAAAAKTLSEAEAGWLMTTSSSSALRPAGLYGGKLVPATRGRAFKLVHYSAIRGLRLSGTLSAPAGRFPFAFKGTVRVSGRNATAGTLHVAGTALVGVLGGRRVAGRL